MSDKELPLEQLANSSVLRYQSLKHIIDFLLALLMIIALAPLLIILVVAIRLESAGPAVYRQIRVGRFGNPFTIFKFR